MAQFALIAVIGAACTWPFVRPYMVLRALEFPERPLAEVAASSADVRSYATAHAAQWVWGARLRAHPKPEGELFPGLMVVYADGRPPACHRAAYLNGGDAAVVQWLENGGAARTATFGTDVLYTVRR